jgi:hypothetical protein
LENTRGRREGKKACRCMREGRGRDEIGRKARETGNNHGNVPTTGTTKARDAGTNGNDARDGN